MHLNQGTFRIMTRIFSSSGNQPHPERNQKLDTEQQRKQAEEAAALFQLKNPLIPETEQETPQGMSAAQIKYERYDAPGSAFAIDHGPSGTDYIFQLLPKQPLKSKKADVVTKLIAVMDTIYPRSVSLTYIPPNERLEVTFYTVKVSSLTSKPGWKRAVKKTLMKLSAVRD